MKTIILCGGQGTRIRDVADSIPKPMISIGDLPILWHIMKTYSVAGYEEFVLCLGYKSHVIKDFFLNYDTFTSDFTISLGGQKEIDLHGGPLESNWRVTLAETGLDAMTGARVCRVKKYINDEDFMITYGDGLADVDFHALVAFHKAHGKIMTVTGVRPPGRFGEMEINADSLITEFNEKPQATGGRISGGFFVCRPELFNYLTDNEDLVFEQEPMRALCADKQLMVYKHDGFWQCMDTYRDFQMLNRMWTSHCAPWKNWR